jgi:two-component system, OmpR family, phosphate regulon response regulator PhoB
MMPRLTGDELCRQLKAEPGLAETKVVLMSAAGGRRAENTGADAFIHKPFDLDTIEKVVEELIA